MAFAKLTDFDAYVLGMLRENTIDVYSPGLKEHHRAVNRLIKKGLAEEVKPIGKVKVTAAGVEWLKDEVEREKRHCAWCGEKIPNVRFVAGSKYCSDFCASIEGEVDRICEKDKS